MTTVITETIREMANARNCGYVSERLAGDVSLFVKEISAEAAKILLYRILQTDMAYGLEVMPTTVASHLVKKFFLFLNIPPFVT
jgi:hypothetical protein